MNFSKVKSFSEFMRASGLFVCASEFGITDDARLLGVGQLYEKSSEYLPK